MSLKPIIDDIADQADDFLDGVTTRSDARAVISEQLTIQYPRLSGAERGKVVDGVLAVLDSEEFFGSGVGSAVEDADSEVDGE
jgi:hypothetical protein